MTETIVILIVEVLNYVFKISIFHKTTSISIWTTYRWPVSIFDISLCLLYFPFFRKTTKGRTICYVELDRLNLVSKVNSSRHKHFTFFNGVKEHRRRWALIFALLNM
ncbi:hypothetical protein ACJX0J_014517, partial [Zea mays]